MNRTTIQWTDFTSNPIKFRDSSGKVVWACEKVSPGCANCYAEALANRYRKGHAFTKSNTEEFGVTPFLDEKEIKAMMNYGPAAGKRCFVGDMSDTFWSLVPDAMILSVFEVMVHRTTVTWQILTKRAERMHEWVNKYHMALLAYDGVGCVPNIHLGVSVENDEWAAKRIPFLRKTAAGARFVSYEPALGPVDWARHLGYDPNIDWLIVGGESGHGARPFNVQWARDTIAWCKKAGVACFLKQLGAVPVENNATLRAALPSEPSHGGGWTLTLKDRSGGTMEEWPEDIRVREFPCPRS